jgi:hypothetical protein
MNFARIALASLGGFVAYFFVGGLLFVTMPFLKTEFLKYPAVYRDHDGQISHMPAGMAAMFVSIATLAVLYAMLYPGGLSIGQGTRLGAEFGTLIGIFAIGAFTMHNWVNLQIGLKIALEQSVAYFCEWLVVGIVIGLIYRPVAS